MLRRFFNGIIYGASQLCLLIDKRPVWFGFNEDYLLGFEPTKIENQQIRRRMK